MQGIKCEKIIPISEPQDQNRRLVGHLKSVLVPPQNDFSRSKLKGELEVEVGLQCLDNFRSEISKLSNEAVVISLNQKNCPILSSLA